MLGRYTEETFQDLRNEGYKIQKNIKEYKDYVNSHKDIIKNS